MKIQTTESVKENKIKCVISGSSGSGKTRSVKFLKDAGYKPLILSFESGLLSIANTGIDYIDGTKDDSGNIIPKEQRALRLAEMYRYLLSEEAIKKYDTIFIDSLSEISQAMFDYLKKEFPDRKDALVLYGELGQKMRDTIKSFRDISHYNVVMTCLSKVDKDDNGRRFASFDLIGSIADKLPQFFDQIFYIKTNQEGKPEYICQSTDSIIAKDRSGKLALIEPYDLGSIFNKILQTTKQGEK